MASTEGSEVEWIEEVGEYEESSDSIECRISPSSNCHRPQHHLAQILDEQGHYFYDDASRSVDDFPDFRYEYFHVDRTNNRATYAKKHFSKEGNTIHWS